MYCYVDLQLFRVENSQNCRSTIKKLGALSIELNFEPALARDSKNLLRCLAKMFDVYNRRGSNGSK
jgi:hypothetical protein